jgi:IS5 family transposase
MATFDSFRARLDSMIDLRHPLAALESRMPWAQIESNLAPLFAHRDRAGRWVGGMDLFGPTVALAGAGVSPAGRPRLPIRLMVALLHLKHAYGLSDNGVIERWAQDVCSQFLSGQAYFEARLPCDKAQLSRFRKGLGEAGVEELLKTTIEASVAMAAVKKAALQHVILDTTVQEKVIAHPTDSRLLDVACAKIVRLARHSGIKVKLTHEREATALRRRAGTYPHARQFERLKKVLRRQRTILGILLCEVQRKMTGLAPSAQDKLNHWMTLAERIRTQRPKDKNTLYPQHSSEAECVSEGKSRNPYYEFGVTASVAVTHKHSLIVAARAFPGDPYDGHTLAEQSEQTTDLLQDCKVKPTTAIVNLGYRGVDHLVPAQVVHRGRFKPMRAQLRRWLKRRQAAEPVIGNLKADHGMKRCWLKGSEGYALHTVLCAARFNLHWLLRTVARMGLRDFVPLVLTARMSAARALQDLHQRVSGIGNRIFLAGGHRIPAGVVE